MRCKLTAAVTALTGSSNSESHLDGMRVGFTTWMTLPRQACDEGNCGDFSCGITQGIIPPNIKCRKIRIVGVRETTNKTLEGMIIRKQQVSSSTAVFSYYDFRPTSTLLDKAPPNRHVTKGIAVILLFYVTTSA